MVSAVQKRILPPRRKPLPCHAARRSASSQPTKKRYKAKPYEKMPRPGERIQIDVKVVPRSCIADLRLYQYTAIDEYSRFRILGAYPEQSTYSSAVFLKRVVASFVKKGIKVLYA